jgi:hypothetical protein
MVTRDKADVKHRDRSFGKFIESVPGRIRAVSDTRPTRLPKNFLSITVSWKTNGTEG